MIHPGLDRSAPGRDNMYNTQPYAVMEFDSLLTTALSCQLLDNQLALVDNKDLNAGSGPSPRDFPTSVDGVGLTSGISTSRWGRRSNSESSPSFRLQAARCLASPTLSVGGGLHVSKRAGPGQGRHHSSGSFSPLPELVTSQPRDGHVDNRSHFAHVSRLPTHARHITTTTTVADGHRILPHRQDSLLQTFTQFSPNGNPAMFYNGAHPPPPLTTTAPSFGSEQLSSLHVHTHEYPSPDVPNWSPGQRLLLQHSPETPNSLASCMASPPMRGQAQMLNSSNNDMTNSTISPFHQSGPVPFGGVNDSVKPGPNLIRPIAFKPTHSGSAHSPGTQASRRGDDHLTGSHDMPRPQGMKLGTSMLGVIRSSPDTHSNHGNQKAGTGAFNSTSGQHQQRATPTPLNSSMDHILQTASVAAVGSAPGQTPQQQQHPQTANFHPASVNSSHQLTPVQNSSANPHNTSATSSRLSGADETNSFTGDFPRPGDRPDSVPSFNANRVSSHAAEGVLQTPSPSDSGVGELEAILREKDAEINTLREVMDRNERAIFQVYEERKNVWMQDAHELREDYERKLKIQSRKSYKTEQVLSLQVYKLQQEQKALQEEKATVTGERDTFKQQVEDREKEIAELKAKLEAVFAEGIGAGKVSGGEECEKGQEAGGETELSDADGLQAEVTLKNKELITLKSEVQCHQAEMEKKNKELGEKVKEVNARTEDVRVLKEELDRIKNPAVLVDTWSQTHTPSEVSTPENVKPSMLGERERIINGLQEELMELRTEVLALKEEHDREKEQWLDEKNKVVRYQKQLQLNYVQMQRKNNTLETEVQQLTLELENRDMKLIALNGEESVC